LTRRNSNFLTLIAFRTRAETHWLARKSHVMFEVAVRKHGQDIHLFSLRFSARDPSSERLFSHSLTFRNFGFWHKTDLLSPNAHVRC
jgi:hypothetical protein